MAAIHYRYAHALAAVIADHKLDPAATQQQLNDFVETLNSSADLREVLENPSIPEPQKLHLLDALAARLGWSQPVRNFLAVITHHQRLHELAETVAAYATVADEDAQVAEVDVVSAHPLDASSRTLLEGQIGKLVGGRSIKASYSQDATLLGGAIVHIGSTVYDGSIRGQLQQMKQRLMTATA